MNELYRISPPSALIFRDENGEQTVEGIVVPYGEWSEVDSVMEGNFMERFSAGSLRKSFAEGFARMKGYFEHGRDRVFGRTAIMELREAWETDHAAFFRANLLRGLPEWMIDGLDRGLYGASIGAEPIKVDRVRRAEVSATNPKGLEERTYKEVRAFDISLTPAPHYAGATVALRSITDELAVEQLIQNPERLLQILRDITAEAQAEPTHSEPTAPDAEAAPEDETAEPQEEPAEEPSEEQPEADPEEPEGSRATQPPPDYLKDETEEEWLL